MRHVGLVVYLFLCLHVSVVNDNLSKYKRRTIVVLYAIESSMLPDMSKNMISVETFSMFFVE